ncbi:hypothetical protein, partial [Nostoc sp.]|uniref:hypothetical protein n=1 Tax=Nostoc sp. TaxID=1180 RepID=UPI002FF6FC64
FVPPWQEITITISRFSIGWDFYLWKESCTSRNNRNYRATQRFGRYTLTRYGEWKSVRSFAER